VGEEEGEEAGGEGGVQGVLARGLVAPGGDAVEEGEPGGAFGDERGGGVGVLGGSVLEEDGDDGGAAEGRAGGYVERGAVECGEV